MCETMQAPSPMKAYVRTVGGVPRLEINGALTSGNMVFLNGDTIAKSAEIYRREMAYIGAVDFHRYSTITNLQFGQPGASEAMAAARLDALLENDPQADILLRVKTEEWDGEGVPKEDVFTFGDGSLHGYVSIASDRWFAAAKEQFAAVVKMIRSTPRYASRVLGYHLEWNEWMQPFFVESVDCSPTNSRKFREWLTAKYATTPALQAAWGTEATLENACVPADLPIGINEKALMLADSDRWYIDYLDYIGELTASRIDELAQLVKELTDGESVVLSFYGYYFEVYHATSGHFHFRRLLDSPWLDGFAGPTTYMDRHGGGNATTSTSGYMTVVDSVTRAGKLWVMESDQRTVFHRTEDPPETYYYNLRSVEEIACVHKREVGIAMVHGASLYPMDLCGFGWYDDPAIWTHFAPLDAACTAYKNAQSASTYDVVLVVDERAQSMVGCSMLSNRELPQMMLRIYRAGVRFALAELGDVLSGKFDDGKLYWFVNPYHLTGDEVTVLCDRLHREGKTAVFQYAFAQTADEDVRRLTGMSVSLEDVVTGHEVTINNDLLPGVKDLGPININGVSRVESGAQKVLAYHEDGSVAAALHEEADWRAIFFGSAGISAAGLREVCRLCGVPVLCDSEDVCVANQELVVFNTSTPGDKTLRFPTQCDVYDYFADRWYEGVTVVTLPDLEAADCRWFFYGDRATIESYGLPVWKED